MTAYLWRFAIHLLSVERFASAFLLTTSSDRATIGNEFNFTCSLAKDSNGIISIVRDHIDECIIDVDRTCRLLNCNPNYDYSCNGSTIILTLSGNFDIDSLHGSRWKCHDILRDMDSNEMLIYVNVPITQVNLTTIPYDINPTKIISGSRQSFKCTTDAGRPSSRIQWYLSGYKINDDASVQTDTCNPGCNGKVISSSVLLYTGNTTDNKKTIYCSADNIHGEVRSQDRIIEILFEPVILKIPDINIIEGSNLKITPTIYANPAPISVWWTLQNVTDFRWYGRNLIIRNIQRDFRGNYTCHAMNTITASGQPPENSTSADKFYVDVQLLLSDESINGATIGVGTGFAVIVFTLGVISLFVLMHRKRRMFRKREEEDSRNIVYESTLMEKRQRSQTDMHVYNELQGYKTDDNHQQNRASKSSNTYEEFGEVKSNKAGYINTTMQIADDLQRNDKKADIYVNIELKPARKI